MTLRHNLREFQPGNAKADRSDWNEFIVVGEDEKIDPGAITERVVEDLPDRTEGYGYTGSDVDRNDDPKSIWIKDKTNEDCKWKNLPKGDPEGDPLEQLTDRITRQIERVKEAGGHVQGNSVAFNEHTFTASPQYFRPDTDPNKAGEFDKERTKKWLEQTLEFVQRTFGKRLAGIQIHLDEATPHIHAETVPVHNQNDTPGLSTNAIYDQELFRAIHEGYANHLPEQIQEPEVGEDAEKLHPTETYETLEAKLDDDIEDFHDFKEKHLPELRNLRTQVRENVPPGLLADLTDKPEPDDEENAINWVMDHYDVNSIEAGIQASLILTKAGEKNEELSDKVHELQTEVEVLESQVKQQSDRIETLESERDELRDELGFKKAENKSLKEALDEVAEENNLSVSVGENGGIFTADYSDPGHEISPDM